MIRPLLAGAACLALLTACNDRGASPAVDKAQDMAAAPVGQASAATFGANTIEGYVPAAAMGDMYEIQSAEIALRRSTNASVKELATLLRTDHTAAANMFRAPATADASAVALPTALDERRQGMIDNLNSASAADFDRVFLDQQIAAHNEALTLHRGFANNSGAPGLAGHARTVTPKIEAHLRMAEQIKSGM